MIAVSLGFVVASLASVSKASDTLFESLRDRCGDCHADGAAEGGFELRTLDSEITKDNADRWHRVAGRIHSGEMPPETSDWDAEHRGEVVKSIRKRLRRIGEAETEHGMDRRLNNRELAAALVAVLGIEDVGTNLPMAGTMPDPLRDGFDSDSEALNISQYHLAAYLQSIRRVLDATLLEGPRPNRETWSVPAADLAVHGVGQTGNRRTSHRRGDGWIDLSDPRCKLRLGSLPKIEQTGWYTIEVHAQAMDRGVYPEDSTGIYHADPIRLSIEMGDRIERFALADEAITVIKTRQWLAAGTQIELGYPSDGLRMLGNGNFKFQHRITHDHLLEHDPQLYRRVIEDEVPKAKFRNDRPSHWVHWVPHWRGPRPRVFEVRVSGPEYDQWPPVRQRDLLGPSPKIRDIEEILHRFARRAWRREPEKAELEPMVALVRMHGDESGDEATLDVAAIREGMLAVLMSPSFLLIDDDRIDSADRYASRISRMFTASPPSAELLHSVRAGDLDDRDGIEAYVKRQIASGKINEFAHRFPVQWLELDRINFMGPDPDRFPFYNRKNLAEDMIGEVQHFFADAVRRDLPAHELLLANHSFLNADLARIYGVDGVESDSQYRLHEFQDGRRGGLLGMGAFLTLTADSLSTSPIHRGVYVLEKFLGVHPAPPPGDLEIPEPDVRQAKTVKEILAAHAAIETCGNCHRHIDPFGYAFENFGPTGAWRDEYEVRSEGEHPPGSRPPRLPIDASAEFANGKAYDGIVEFRGWMRLPANEEKFVRCLIRKLFQYADLHHDLGVAEIDLLYERSAERGHHLQHLIATVMDSDTFRGSHKRQSVADRRRSSADEIVSTFAKGGR